MQKRVASRLADSETVLSLVSVRGTLRRQGGLSPSAVHPGGLLRRKRGKTLNPTVFVLIGKLTTLRRAWQAILLLMIAFESSVALADDSKQPSFGFVDGSAVTLSPGRSDRFKLDLAIKNAGTMEGVPSLKLLSDMDKKCDHADIATEPHPPAKLSPNAVAIAHVTISGVEPPATCYIALTTLEQGNTSLKQIKLAQQYVTSTMFYSLWACVLISAFVAIATWVAARIKLGGVSLFYKLGSPAWDFTKSWTSTTTLAGAIISTALTLSALPELTKYASKSGYAALAMLISLAVVVAPFVFVAFRNGEIAKDPATGNDTVIYKGCLWLFLVSGAITLFAGLAQVVLLFLLLDEIFLDYVFWSFSPDRHPWLALNVGSVSTGALLVALCWYVSHSMFLTIKLQKQADIAAAAANIENERSMREKGISRNGNDDARGAKGPLLTWPVL